LLLRSAEIKPLLSDLFFFLLIFGGEISAWT